MIVPFNTYHDFTPGYRVTMRLVLAIIIGVGVFLPATASASVRVIFLPFEDKVKLNEAWNLSVDIPRWFSQTVDTIGTRDTLVRAVPFDTTLAFIKRSGWKRAEYCSPEKIMRLAAMSGADMVVTGTVQKFMVMKRALNGDGTLSGTTAISGTSTGQGGATIMAGLQAYTADVKMAIVLYSAQNGLSIDNFSFDSHEKEGGLKIWLPIQTENDEVNFYYLSRTPFGSDYFHKSVVGALMKSLSQQLRDNIKNKTAVVSAAPPVSRQFLSGRVLDRVAKDVYLNLGSSDNLVPGDTFEVLKPVKPIIEGNDTLGWTEDRVAFIMVRVIKSNHFSQAMVLSEQDSIRSGWTVRLKVVSPE